MLLCLWASALYLGLLVGLHLGLAPVLSMPGMAAMGGAALACSWLWRRRRLPATALFFALGALGVAVGGWASRTPVYPVRIAAALEDAGPEVWVEGEWFRTLKRPGPLGGGRGLLGASRVAGETFAVRLAITGARGRTLPAAGDQVRLKVRLAVPVGLANPGMTDARWLAQAQGIDLVAVVSRDTPILILRAGATWGGRRLAERARNAMAAAIDREVSGTRGALLKALVLGERNAAGPEVEAGFKSAGAVHALSVSGLHLTAIAAALFLLLRRSVLCFPRLALASNPDVWAAALSIPSVMFYCAITGEAIATRRAALMAGLAMGAVVLRRTPSLPSAIGAAALALLVDSPFLVVDPSFQLSFASVIALALVSGRWQSHSDAPWWRQAAIWIGRGLLVSGVAFAVTAPLVAHHFAELAPVSPLGNLLLVPPVEVGIVPIGLLGSALGAAWRPLGYVPLHLADWLCGLVLFMAEGFRLHAPLLPVPSPDGFEAGAVFLAAILTTAAGAGQAWRSPALVAAGLAAVIGGGHMGVRFIQRRYRDGVQVTFLNVGQGDAALVEGPQGFVALIDGGGTVEGTFDPGARVIEPVLRRKIIGHIDLVVLSHPHPDHMNGLFRVFERFSVGTLWTSGDGAGEPSFDRLIALARRRGVRVSKPARLDQHGLVFEPLGPYVGSEIAPPLGLEANDASLVLRLVFAGRRVLFTGDIEEQGESELLGRHPPVALQSDVLKVPHHGSRTSSSDELLAAVAPKVAVASLGQRNRFGFPRPEVVARYEARGIRLLRTDRRGALNVAITRDGVLRTTCVRGCR